MQPKYKNIILILGTTIGAGMYSLPFVIQKIGLLWFICLLVVFTLITFRLSWYFAEVERTVPGKHQLAGYVRLVFGPRWAQVAGVFDLMSVFGALIAFTIVGGSFLTKVAPFSPLSGSLMMYLLVVALMLAFFGRMAKLNVWLSFIKIASLLTVMILAFYEPAKSNVDTVLLYGNQMPTVSLGTLLFSLAGFSIVPELFKNKNLEWSIGWSQGIIAIVYLLFSLSVFRFISGSDFIFPNSLTTFIFNATGVVSVLTAYLILSWVGFDILSVDLRWPKPWAFLIIIIVPAIFVLFPVGTFLGVLGFTGGVFVGGNALFITAMFVKQHPHKHPLEIFLVQFIIVFTVLAELYAVLQR